MLLVTVHFVTVLSAYCCRGRRQQRQVQPANRVESYQGRQTLLDLTGRERQSLERIVQKEGRQIHQESVASNGVRSAIYAARRRATPITVSYATNWGKRGRKSRSQSARTRAIASCNASALKVI